MRHRLAAALLAGTLAWAVAGCGDDGSDPEGDPTTLQPTTEAPSSEPSDSPGPSESSEPSDSPEPSGDPTDGAADVQAAIDELADRLGVPAADIEAGPLERVTWSNGSLGCPERGMSYPEVLTDGYRLILTAAGEEYAYHAGADGELTYCADPMDPVSDDVDES